VLGTVEVDMWKPWEWPRSSNEVAVGNARSAATELARCAVERHEVELFIRQHRTVSLSAVGATPRPA